MVKTSLGHQGAILLHWCFADRPQTATPRVPGVLPFAITPSILMVLQSCSQLLSPLRCLRYRKGTEMYWKRKRGRSDVRAEEGREEKVLSHHSLS